MMENSKKNTEEKLAQSLTAESIDLIPYLPYLLQDLWSLGTPPEDVIRLLRESISVPPGMRVLDLACGKGAVGIPLAKELGVRVHMVDIVSEFVDFARKKAAEWEVAGLCSFESEDIVRVSERERGWDCVMFLGAGDVLGTPEEAAGILREIARPEGYILWDEVYVREAERGKIRYDKNGDYPTYEGWLEIFEQNGLQLIAAFEADEECMTETNARNNRFIAQRAEELILRHPDREELFRGYVRSQQDESYDLENDVVGTLWLLRR